LGLAAQRRVLAEAAGRRGWDVVWVEDVSSGKSLKRQGLQRALEMLRAGEIGTLAITKIDRVSRDVGDFARLVAQAKVEGWEIVVVLEPFDMTTAIGRYLANIMAANAQLERELIGERTVAALRERRAAGVVLGRPRKVPGDTVQRIEELARGGLGVAQIARVLTAEGFATPTGKVGRWRPQSVLPYVA
jgi:DNA invertase Pin-like site-specific DNA recombinase